MDTLGIILLFKATTGGGSMRRGYDTTARRPSTRYCLHLLLSLNIKMLLLDSGYDQKSNSHVSVLLAEIVVQHLNRQVNVWLTIIRRPRLTDLFFKKAHNWRSTKTVYMGSNNGWPTFNIRGRLPWGTTDHTTWTSRHPEYVHNKHSSIRLKKR